jgi:heme exporter protein A
MPVGPQGQSAGIRLRDLRRDYGERTALRDASLVLERGQTLAVLGPNGSGKTTLLRLLATLLRPTSGEVDVLGHRLPGEGWRLRGRIGFLGHEPLLYGDLTGRENLRLHAELHGLEANPATKRIDSLLEAVRMERRAEERVRTLSAGMRQRLAVCRAVLHEPELLLLDEPDAHLDPEGRALVEPLIGSAEGRTRVVASHDPEGALAGADQVLALGHGGMPAFSGPARELSADRLAGLYEGAPA